MDPFDALRLLPSTGFGRLTTGTLGTGSAGRLTTDGSTVLTAGKLKIQIS